MTNVTESYTENIDDDLHQLVIFNLGVEEFGINIMQVQEIIRMPDITRIPRSPEYVKGVINLRGKIIVVMDLDRRFGMNETEMTDDSRIVVVDINGTIIGLVVDSVSEVIRLKGSNIEQTPEIITQKINAEYLKGVGKMEDRLLILLNLENIITETAAA
ncbi:chemotaxis protein CheW [Methanolobus sp. WCC1]|jgi:purine-binding chemotaxis protein CheW|uniref:Chemotaxis signal transduction protein n=1 Tax=Methanolobus tindarius DSM 2278 TaxID=1090322 RepID=W9E001_METTI|nr:MULTISPECIES: chemotaxis protein CheW [Methanolobus]ETA69272.1 chemotaxis signal transduction protein [Methanolobus tindarius DSM 2278]MDK2832289.1 purine-binding chemotaxis protein CheW [Methanolobus sp.]